MKTFDPRHTLTQLLFMLLAFIMPTAAMAVNDASDDESPEAIEEEEVVEEETGPSLDEAMMLQISGTMESYLKELQVIADGIPKARKPKLASLEKKMTSLNVRWEAYNKVVEAEVAQSEVLLEMVSQFKNLSQAVNDSLDIQKQRAEAIVNFEKFEDSLPSWSKKYDKLQREALEYSLVPQTAQLLARVKNEEQLLSQELDQKYGEAKAAAELNPSLKERMKKVEQHYLTLKGTSEEIQATEYKSLFDRAKDYVLMFAGVAVILMFLSMVQNKIKQVKAAREAAKQYKDMLMNSNKEIPTICLALMAMLFTACSSRVRNVVVQRTPQSEGMTVSDMKISDDCRTMTLKARVNGTPDLLDLADTTKVNIKVTEYMQYLIPCIEDVYPSLVSIKGIGPEQVKKRGLVMHVLVDLTQPSKGLSKQREYVNILRKLFCHDNLYLTFMLGEGKTSATMAATDYVVSNYISAQSPLRETVFTDEGELMSPYIYQSTLTMLNRLDSSRKEVGDSATYRLLMLFTDGKVYDDDDYPLDPDHFDVQEKLIRKARTLPDNLSVYYVDLSANEEDEINENNMLRMLCQETKGQCLPSLDNVKLDDFILSSFNIDYDDYIIELRNPEKKYFFGNHRYVCLTFTNKSDSLLAKAYKDYQIASIYQPKHIGDMPLPSIAFQGIVLGLVIMIAVYLVMQFLLPFLSYLWFRYRYVVKYTGPNMSVGNIIVPGECYLCKAPFTLGEKVVVKCKHVTHEECWKDNGHRCPEHGVHCIDQPDAQRFLRINVQSGIKHLLGHAHAYQSGQPLGAPKAGRDAQAYLGLPEHCVIGRQADVAAHGQFVAAAQCKAVDRSDDGQGELLDIQEDIVAQLAESFALSLGHGAHGSDIGTGYKAFFPCAGKHHAADGVLIDGLKSRLQVGQDLGVQGVESLGPVDGDNGYGSLDLGIYKCHGMLLTSPRWWRSPYRRRCTGWPTPYGRPDASWRTAG